MNHHLCDCVSSLSFSNGLSLCVLQLGLIHSPFHVAFSCFIWGCAETGHPNPQFRATKEAKNLAEVVASPCLMCVTLNLSLSW